MKGWFSETLYSKSHIQSIKKDTSILNINTKFQKLEIFENSFFGKVLALDDIVQTTEKDEFFYHEMMVHVPLISHNNPKNVLIIGGGDGGILRETLKHKNISRVVMIEIDFEVTQKCKEFMPSISNGAFLDKRADVRFIDGIEFINNNTDSFDIIIVDSTDPVGCAKPLFSSEFYHKCQRCLGDDGILVNQAGVPFYQDQEIKNVSNGLESAFRHVNFYLVPVPTYIGGFMTLGFASNTIHPNNFNHDLINSRLSGLQMNLLKYYNKNIHISCFDLPNYIKTTLVS